MMLGVEDERRAAEHFLEAVPDGDEEVPIERLERLGGVVGVLIAVEPAAQPLVEPRELAAQRAVGTELLDPVINLGEHVPERVGVYEDADLVAMGEGIAMTADQEAQERHALVEGGDVRLIGGQIEPVGLAEAPLERRTKPVGCGRVSRQDDQIVGVTEQRRAIAVLLAPSLNVARFVVPFTVLSQVLAT